MFHFCFRPFPPIHVTWGPNIFPIPLSDPACCISLWVLWWVKVAWWKLREENLQDEYGKLAPAVSKYPDFYILGCKEGTVSSATAQFGMQTAWFSAALEELSQMCGAFLEATTPSTPRLGLMIHAGEALNFCDALVVAAPPSGSARPRGVEKGGDSQGESRSPPAPVMFQQYTLQPLQLRAETLRFFADGCPAFDVINTSNLAEHLGKDNILKTKMYRGGSCCWCHRLRPLVISDKKPPGKVAFWSFFVVLRPKRQLGEG